MDRIKHFRAQDISSIWMLFADVCRSQLVVIFKIDWLTKYFYNFDERAITFAQIFC